MFTVKAPFTGLHLPILWPALEQALTAAHSSGHASNASFESRRKLAIWYVLSSLDRLSLANMNPTMWTFS